MSQKETHFYTPEEARAQLARMHYPEYTWDRFMNLQDSEGSHAVKALIMIARGSEAQDFYAVYLSISDFLAKDELDQHLEQLLCQAIKNSPSRNDQ